MDYRPLFFALGIIIIIGVLMPLVVLPYVDYEFLPEDSAMVPLIDLVQNGISIFGFELNIFGFLGNVQDDFVNYLSMFAFIPDIILIPMIILIITAIVYTIIKMFPTT